ncbi:MAG TPA: aldo/keto reductase, partial [Microthrixaceae bacterium]|nr:aldo/keto reductase [Microthrixaceae bacterium]
MVDPSKPGRFSPGRLSIGTAPLGGLYSAVSQADALATLEAAAVAGVTHFDTAPHYGRGLAEQRLGEFLRRVDEPQRFSVSTKVGRRVHQTASRQSDDIFVGAPPGESVFDFAPSAIREELTESRTRLGREFIDVVLIHDPDNHLDEALMA